MTIGQNALALTVIIAAPMLLSALTVGLFVGMIQAATQINEMTLSFIPKLLVLVVALYIGSGWMLDLITGYSKSLILSIPSLIG